MWFRGTKGRVGIWFVLWSRPETGYNAKLYKTPYGLRSWLTNPAFRNLPVVRAGRMILTESGCEEKEHWTREEFLESREPA